MNQHETNERLKEICCEMKEVQQDMLEKLEMLHEMVREADGMTDAPTLARAEAYWIGHIQSSLSNDLGNPYDTSVDTTIKEIKEWICDDFNEEEGKV